MASLAKAYPIYTVSTIPIPLGWWNITVTGINDVGQIAGYGLPGSGIGITAQAFLATTTSFLPIPNVPAQYFVDTANLNNLGQVATNAAIGTAGGTTLVPASPFDSVRVNGINNSGAIVGQGFIFGAANQFQAFAGTLGGVTPIAFPASFGDSEAWDINAAGQIVGVVDNGGWVPFIADSTGLHYVPVPAGWTLDASQPLHINASGKIVGSVRDGSGAERSFFGDANGTILIPAPPGYLSANAPWLNNANRMVGGGAGWVWDSTNGAVALNFTVAGGWASNSGEA